MHERINPQVQEVEDKPREACGVLGIFSKTTTNLANPAYMALLDLQHRGQDGAGIAIHNLDTGFMVQKEEGLVSNVFNEGRYLDGLPEGNIAVGHARYGTSQNGGRFNALQPLHSENGGGYVIAHNGHIEELSQVSADETDTEQLVHQLNQRLEKGDNIVTALKEVLSGVDGAYSLVISDGEKLIGIRDPHGFRPLSLAENGDICLLASEDSALRGHNLTIRDVRPGEIVVISEKGVDSDFIPRSGEHTTCGLEYAYFARPDSTIDGINVQQTREHMGELLVQQEMADFQADMVVGVPDSGVAAAFGYARQSSIPLEQALTKNRYISRTFIKATQADRERAVQMKLHPNSEMIARKRLVVIDDSIVRGTTTKTLVKMLRDAGAAEVHLRISWPPYKWPCYYGMDTGNPDELLANRRSKTGMMEYLGVNSLDFLNINGVKEATKRKIGGICLACVDARYPTMTSGEAI